MHQDWSISINIIIRHDLTGYPYEITVTGKPTMLRYTWDDVLTEMRAIRPIKQMCSQSQQDYH